MSLGLHQQDAILSVSSYRGKEKKLAWETCPEATEVFLALSNPVDDVAWQ